MAVFPGDFQGLAVDVEKALAAFDFDGGQRRFDPTGIDQNVIEVTNDGVVDVVDVFVEDLAENKLLLRVTLGLLSKCERSEKSPLYRSVIQ